MKLLITGGLGLIGRGVLRHLARSRPDVDIRIADLRLPPAKNSSLAVEVVQGDICDPEFVERAIRGCDIVLHLAGHLGVSNTEADHLTCLETNIMATRSLLDACVRHEVSRVVIASSSEVYGDVGGQLSETTQVRPKSVYAVAKLAAEKYALAYHQRHGLDARVIRFFNVYGPWQRDDFVMSRFVHNLRMGRAPEVYGDGTQVRSFCHVDDAAPCAVSLALAPDLPERVFNIGNDREPIQMRELAEHAIRAAGLDLEPVFVSFQNSDRSATREIQRRIPDIQRARELLRYEPRISLDEGLRQLLTCPELELGADLLVSGLLRRGAGEQAARAHVAQG